MATMPAATLELPSFLAAAPAEVRRAFASRARPLTLPTNRQVAGFGQACRTLSFVVRGSVRVYLVGEDGRAVTLYRVEAGQACVLTAACVLGETAFPAAAETEGTVRAWAIPADLYRSWVAQHAFWRDYTFRLLGQRLAAVLGRLQANSFVRVEARLAAQLQSAAPRTDRGLTHQRLAEEIGTAREVVSRCLTRWERAGWVRLGRRSIEILDPGRLGELAALCD